MKSEEKNRYAAKPVWAIQNEDGSALHHIASAQQANDIVAALNLLRPADAEAFVLRALADARVLQVVSDYSRIEEEFGSKDESSGALKEQAPKLEPPKPEPPEHRDYGRELSADHKIGSAKMQASFQKGSLFTTYFHGTEQVAYCDARDGNLARLQYRDWDLAALDLVRQTIGRLRECGAVITDVFLWERADEPDSKRVLSWLADELEIEFPGLRVVWREKPTAVITKSGEHRR